MVLLYQILRNPRHESTDSVCEDIELGIEVFQAMGGHQVAKRCLELVSEVYDLAKNVIEETHPQNVDLNEELFPNLIDPFLLEEFAFHDDSTHGVHPPPWNAELDTEESSSALGTFLSFMANRYDEGNDRAQPTE